jgi:TolB protein
MLSRRALLAAALAPPAQKFFFTARGSEGVRGAGSRLGVQRADGSGLEILDFHEPDHIGWLPYCFFRDGRRAILMSLELIPGWRTKTFDEYYPQSKTHLWLYDMETGRREELATKERLSNFIAPCLLMPGEDRLAVTVNKDGKQRLYTIDLDGRHAQPVSAPDEFVYGVSLSPDGRQFAYHANYRIATINADGTNRQEVNGAKGKLMFGTTFSPDGEWVLYQICTPKTDPAHDWSDLWIGRPDGSANRALTTGNAAWFGATYGAPSNPGGGSNMPQWTRHGILFAERSPGAKTPWEFQPQRPDTDHFNRDYKPAAARRGTRITQIDPKTGEKRALTLFRENNWDFRMSPSATGDSVLFCRAATGENPALWIMDSNGANPRYLNRGANNHGADHPRW